MISIVLAILMGLGFTFIALQNPSIIPVNIFGSVIQLPLYLFAAISFLAGIFIALVFQLFDTFATYFNISQQNSEMRRIAKTNENLQYQINQLNTENQRLKESLKNRNQEIGDERRERRKTEFKNIFNKVREGLT